MVLDKKFLSSNNWRNRPNFKHKDQNTYNKINKKKNTKLRKILSTFFLIFLLFFFIGGTVGAVYYAWLLRNLPSPDKIIDRQLEQSTKIYARDGKTLLYEIHGDQNRTLLTLDEVNPSVIWATLSAEDRNFYNHSGFDFKGTARSLIKNILTGSRVGGSTITQQFVKNAVLTPEKTYTRKIKELLVSFQLEKKFTKDEILQMYLNEIPYGAVTYGIQSASERFFAKNANELSIAESAFLASLPNAPSYYSPYGAHIDKLEIRYKWVIDSMVEEGYITQEQADEAKKEDVFSNLQDSKISIVAPHFVFYVRDVLTEIFSDRLVEQGGLRVITTLDPDMQNIAEDVFEEKRAMVNSFNASNASLVAIDPKNGEILSMVGSFDYFDKEIDGSVNVTLRPRQPGSSFKPIVFATAFSRGYTPNTIVYDVNTTFPTIVEQDGYSPKNYDLKEHGPVSLRKALAGSLNTPAVKLLYLAGIPNVLDLADSLGYTTLKDRSRFGLSLVLGGGEVKLLEHTTAFSVFPNEGRVSKSSPILKVEDSDGKEIYKWKPKFTTVLDTEVARQMNDVLSDNNAREYVFGANSPLYLGYPAAAKTGTTNDYLDAWTIGYTPEIVVGVWVGNNNNDEMRRGAAGGVVAAPIWNAFMKRVVKDKTLDFTKPKPVITGKPILDGEEIPGNIVKIDKTSGKLATDFTPENLIEEKTFKEIHNILYYVNKDNPQGMAPEDPTSDPFYKSWEDAVRGWAESQDFVSELPPVGYDDLHIPANKPSISITSPQNNKSVGRAFNVSVSVSAPRGVSRVEYFVDDELVATANSYPFGTSISLPAKIGNGFHTLKTVAYDDIDNNNTHEININVSGFASQESFVWLSPKNNVVINSFPINITFNMPSAIKVSIWYVKDSGSNYFIIGDKEQPKGYTSITWDPGNIEKGNYQIVALIQDSSGIHEEKLSIVIE